MYRRKIYNKIKDWKDRRQGRTALLIEGARRVGKSTVVEEFARREYESYILIDFASCRKATRDLFSDISDLDFFFLQLQTQTGIRLIERKSLIIFDEVQLCPQARQAIKYLVRDNRYDYIETGSLISKKRNVRNILIPSEEQRISMFPMDFEEFLWALNDDVTLKMLRHVVCHKKALSDGTHRELMRKMRLYMLVGGMPQAVEAYIESNNFEPVDQIKRDILSLYEEDLHKIDERDRLTQIFNAIPAELNKNSSRYSVSSVIPSLRPGSSLNLIAELADSKTVIPVYHTSMPTVDMTAYKDLSRFKLFLSDTGLFVTLMFANRPFVENDLYKKILGDHLSANLGYLFENLVAQMLTAQGYEPCYHTFSAKDKTTLYKIDFLIPDGNKVSPIEVKSSGYKSHASLDAFSMKYSQYIGHKYLIYTKNLAKDHDLQLLPIYLAPFLGEQDIV